ncbi:trans-sulfuration enzyme family protein [Paraburkholderia sp. GAS32]|uniref:trans-sulfuration enzyme family protein n=1 Tax=Paraburkholderia sp. GAS32 TaxID=3035129 RepID=UPI003D1DF427
MKSIPTSKARGFSTKAIHDGYDPQSSHGSLNAPVYMTSTYAFEDAAAAEAVFAGESDRYVYGRQHNPTQALLETRIASLEGAGAALVVGSGMAAITSTLWTFLQSGDEIVCHHTIYSTASMFFGELVRFGISVRKVDVSNTLELQQAVSSKTKFIYFESPVNPTGELIDIARVASVAHASDAKVIIDSTFASPALQTPLKLGADIVIHSLTKYINGHGDVLGGAVVGDADTIAEIRAAGLRYMTGGVISPMSAFLILRGLKTLKVRMRQHGDNALEVAEMLTAHPAVKSVCYPFLPRSPQYELAQQQMSAGTGIISFELKSGYEGARRMMNRLEIITCALSLGDTESLITHPAALIEARKKIKPETQLARGVSREMIRLSVGLEDVQDLIADLEQALQGEQ